jgi:erythromycin esterase-like protein
MSTLTLDYRLYFDLLFEYLRTELERRPALFASVMSSSSDNDEIVSVLALVATESAKREIASQNIGSSIGKAPKRERNFVQKMASIRDDDFVDNNEVRRNGGIVKRYSEEEFERRFRMP